jgi:Ser/Thr protein kinase RdoA (MazF antagonist)
VAAKVARVVDHLVRGGRVAVPALMKTTSGASWHEDDAGGVWRLWEFLAGTRSLDRLSNADQARAAGAAFGRLQLALADLPGEVADAIPGFMRLSHYLQQLDAALAVHTLPPGLEAALARVEPRRGLADSFRERDRLVHGDCKIDNLLFHADRDEVAGIIDLDTVMLGHWAWDFGDLVRSAAADHSGVNVERFGAIAAGFVGTGAVAKDPDALVLAPRYVALMLAVRFLTDHLRGDRYFKVRAPGENLARACRQLDLLEDLERREWGLRTALAGI